MSSRIVITDVATLMEYRGSCAPSLVDFRYGDFAVDAIGLATAEDMLASLRKSIELKSAKILVEQLLDLGLLYDNTIESKLTDAAR